MGDKTERITIRLRPQDKERIKIMAIKKGVTVSELVLCSLIKYIAEEERKQMMTQKE